MYKVKMDGKYLYHPWDENHLISSGKITLEMGKNGTFDCDIPPDNPLYNEMIPRKSIVEVFRFKVDKNLNIAEEQCIYRGVYINDTDGMDMQKEAETDGDMVFLNETNQRPHDRITTPQDEFSLILSNHNGQTDDFKHFYPGIIEIEGASARRYQPGYTDSKTALEELVSVYGGYIRSRYDGVKAYIDWISDYHSASSQGIRYGKNIIDITKYLKSEDVATRIIPLGKSSNGVYTTIKSVNDGRDYIQDDEAISKLGLIEKVVEFSDIASPTLLKQAGEEYLKSINTSSLTIEIQAADLADVDINVEHLNVGDWVPCVAEAYGINTEMQISKISLDILKPSQSTVILGKEMQAFTQNQRKDADATEKKIQEAEKTANLAMEAAQSASTRAITNEEIDEICI